MHRRYGIAFIVALAVLLFSLAFLQPWAPKSLVTNTTLVLFHTFFMCVVVLVCDEVTLRLEGRSLIHEVCRSKRNMLLFLAAGALGGLMLVFGLLGRTVECGIPWSWPA